MNNNKNINVIIAGSRSFNDYDLLCHECDKILQHYTETEIAVFTGGADGADALGEKYAKERNYTVRRFPADWKTYGRAAGPIRNGQMAEEANILICFWDGKSKGTEDMINKAKKKNIQIFIPTGFKKTTGTNLIKSCVSLNNFRLSPLIQNK